MTTEIATGSAARDRRLWVGTSWKMTKTLDEARAFVDELATSPIPTGIQAFLLPAHTALAAVCDRLAAESGILVGAQNAHWEPDGPVTGEVSMRMVSDAGAALVEIGHSERRERFGENDRTAALKVAAAIAHDLVPLVCVGEPARVRDQGGTQAYVAAQVRGALAAVEDASAVSTVIVAYEPVWAIGADGKPATAEQVAPVMATIHRLGQELTDGDDFRAVLYGGGVGPSNVTELLEDQGTDGVFVGRAGWAAADFAALLDLCSPIAMGRVAA